MKTALRYMAIAATLGLAQAAVAAEPAGSTTSGQAGETSDRTPDKSTPTPQAQQDTSGGKTSDRSPDKNVNVEHQPGAAGTAGSNSGSNTSTGSGADTKMPAEGSGQGAN